MKTNLKQLQEEIHPKIGEGEVEYVFRINRLVLSAYNQGVKDSVEALPKRNTDKDNLDYGEELTKRHDGKVDGYNTYREEAINQLNKLIQ